MFADTVISKAVVVICRVGGGVGGSLCIHKLLPGFMTRAAAEPVLSVHYHSSIPFCVYDGYPVDKIYPTHCTHPSDFFQRRDVTPLWSSANTGRLVTVMPQDGSNLDDSSSV